MSSQTIVAYYKHQIKVKIRSERENSSLGFGSGGSQPYFQSPSYKVVRILGYRKNVTTQPKYVRLASFNCN